jgi:hypothetical protein
MKQRDRAWLAFVAWCRARKLRPLPAHPWTIAAYARWCERRRHRYPMIAEKIRAIARIHVLECVHAPDQHPTVARTLEVIKRNQQLQGRRAALFPVEEAANGNRTATPKQRRASAAQRAVLRSSPRLVARRPGSC